MLIEDCYCAFVWSTDTIFFENGGLARTLTRWEYLCIATELNSSAPFWLELKYTTQRCFHVHVLRTPQVTKPVCFWLIRLKRYCHAPHHTLLWNQPQYPTCPMSIAHQAMPSSGLWPPRPQVGLKQDISLYTCVCLYDSSTGSSTSLPPHLSAFSFLSWRPMSWQAHTGPFLWLQQALFHSLSPYYTWRHFPHSVISAIIIMASSTQGWCCVGWLLHSLWVWPRDKAAEDPKLLAMLLLYTLWVHNTICLRKMKRACQNHASFEVYGWRNSLVIRSE